MKLNVRMAAEAYYSPMKTLKEYQHGKLYSPSH